MTPEEQLNKHIWWFLQKIKLGQLLDGDKVYVPQEQMFESQDPDAPDTNEQVKILQLLKERGAVDWEMDNNNPIDMTGYPKHWFYVISVRGKKFNEACEEYESLAAAVRSKHRRNHGQALVPIRKLTLVELPVGKKYKIVINDDYENTLTVERLIGKTWDTLFMVAKKEYVEVNRRRKASIDYLNTNRRNRLYGGAGYELTKIVKVEDGAVEENIPIEVISQKAFATRANRT